MKPQDELVQYIAENLVNDSDAVTTQLKETNRALIVELHVASDDMGRVIGKNGRVANAIRTLLKATTTRDRKKNIILEIE